MRARFQQLDLWTILDPVPPGTEVTDHGRELTFDELHGYIGRVVIVQYQTESLTYFVAERLERIIPHEGGERAIMYHGKQQRSLMSDIYFASKGHKGLGAIRVFEAIRKEGFEQ